MKKYKLDSFEIISQTEKMVEAASNRYQITVQVARRAKRYDREAFDDLFMKKPVLEAITDILDEQSGDLIR